MRQLLNTMFILSEDIFLALDGKNVVAKRNGAEVDRRPLHTLQSIISFSYAGATPALLGACAEENIGVAFCTPRGKFLFRMVGPSYGNVLLRRMQYRAADDPFQSCRLARMMIFGKVYNARWSVERTRRDHGMRLDGEKLSAASRRMKDLLPQIADERDLDSPAGPGGHGGHGLFRRAERHDPAKQAGLRLRWPEPPPAPGPGERHAVLCLQPAHPRLRLRLRERGAGCLRGLSPPGPAGAGVPGPGHDGGTGAPAWRTASC